MQSTTLECMHQATVPLAESLAYIYTVLIFIEPYNFCINLLIITVL